MYSNNHYCHNKFKDLDGIISPVFIRSYHNVNALANHLLHVLLGTGAKVVSALSSQPNFKLTPHIFRCRNKSKIYFV